MKERRPEMNKTEHIVQYDCERLDTYLGALYKDISRTKIQIMIKKGDILLNNSETKSNCKVKIGDIITIRFEEPKEVDVKAEDIPIDIVYEDECMAVINKEQGMVVHPAPGHYAGTLVNAIMYRIKDLSGINGELRPGIVHRLDKDTSGLIVIAKNDFAHTELQKQIQNRVAKRSYTAIVEGILKTPKATIEAPIGRHKTDRKKMAVVQDGREARTHIELIKQYRGYALIEAHLDTGRTHQIRVHMAYIGHSVVGDPLYGKKKNPFGLKWQALHAHNLSLIHPKTGERMEFNAPLPGYFLDIVSILDKEYEL